MCRGILGDVAEIIDDDVLQLVVVRQERQELFSGTSMFKCIH